MLGRRITLAAASVGCAALLGACGGSSKTTSSSGGAAAAAASTVATAPTTTAPQLTVAQARALARRVNFTPADLPGFKPERESAREKLESAVEKRIKHEMLVCAGAQHLPAHGLLETYSPKFSREHAGNTETAQSGVTLAQSPAIAQEELKAVRSARGAACVARFMGKLLRLQRPSGATIGAVHVSQGTPPAPGSEGSFALRLTVQLSAGAAQVPLQFDLLGFVRGAVEVQLNTGGVPASFPAALEEHLFRTLLERAGH